jgi:hypothetical protein
MPGFARALTRAPILILKEAKAEYVKRVLSSALSRRVKVPLALK